MQNSHTSQHGCQDVTKDTISRAWLVIRFEIVTDEACKEALTNVFSTSAISLTTVNVNAAYFAY